MFQCARLESEYSNITFADTGNQSVQYTSILHSYFNVPDALPPKCFVQPRNTQQVSRIVTVLSQAHCKFAVKGGGHMLYVGSNAIRGGVTIDMRQMRRTTLSTDKKTASVEAGSKWGEVYATLDALGYAIPGGRASDVGVAGLTLGGGNSFFAARYGFVCDNVKNFQLVLGNGSIINANARDNADLFKGLKGGSGNLGLVTRFDFVAFPSGPLWGGIAVYDYPGIEKSFEPFVDFTNNIVTDPYGSLITLWFHNGTSNETAAFNLYEYTGNATEKPYYGSLDPVDAPNPFPKPFTNFTFDKVGKPVSNTLRVASLTNLTTELNVPDRLRNTYAPLIFKAAKPIFVMVNQIIREVLQSYSDKPPYFQAQAQFQPFPRVFTDHSIQRGGNVLGLDRVKDNSILLSFILTWDDPAQDQINRQISNNVLGNVTAYTKSVEAFRPWQYLNYAFEDQDPIGSYGEENVDYLKAVSRKYDPEQTFQKLIPGGWKLGDAGKRNKRFIFNQFGTFENSTNPRSDK